MAKGSHATLGGWEPKHCCYCGERVLVSRQSCGFYFDYETGKAYSWHVNLPACSHSMPKLVP